MTPGSKLNLAALAIRLASACASRPASPRTYRRSSGTSTSRRCRPALSLSWLFATAVWTMLSIETGSRTSEIWPWAARVTSISSSTSRPSRPTWRSRISRRRTRIGLLCSSVRSTLAALAIGASGLRSSCDSIARNWPWRRSARRSAWVRSASVSSSILRSWMSTALPTKPAGAPSAPRRTAAVVDEPAVLAVVTAQPQVERERASAPRSWWRGCRGSARGPRDGRSASSRRRAARSTACAGVGGPGRAEPVVGLRSGSAPDERRCRCRDGSDPLGVGFVDGARGLPGGSVSRFLPLQRVLLPCATGGRLQRPRAIGVPLRPGLTVGMRLSGRRSAVPRRDAGARPKAASAAGGTW